tara:strand:+ start:31886 stop:32875 length:990 start_codon:yes stop_codon:yes gene_type:complete
VQELTLVIEEDQGKSRLDKALSLLCVGQLTRSRITSLIQEGHLKTQAGDVVTNPATKVKGGDVYLITIPVADDPDPVAEDIPLDVVFEDDYLLVINKPVGLVVHPGAGNPAGTLVNALLFHCGDSLSGIGGVKRPGIVHRLDKDTSGLMVVAKTDKAHTELSKQFEDRSLSRTYVAFVLGHLSPAVGTIDKNIIRSDRNRQKMAAVEGKGKTAITHYETIELYAADKAIIASQVKCKLETGRTHQIRVHMAYMGNSIIGDQTYGKGHRNKIINRLLGENPDCLWKNERQALHAQEIHFIHPISKEEMSFTSEVPEDMLALRDLLKDQNR